MSEDFMKERKARSFGAPPVEGTSAVEPTEEEQAPVQEAPVKEESQVGTSEKGTHRQRAFSVIPVSDHGLSFAAEWLPSMETPNYIGETNMLLQYLQFMERVHSVTMPIRACGIDPILFENVECPYGGPDENSRLFPIMPQAQAEEEDEEAVPSDEAEGDYSEEEGEESEASEEQGDTVTAPLYELISVDGDLYMSCATEAIDPDYLNAIIAEATAAVKERGVYVYNMVGLRKLALEEGKQTARLLNTLRLNTYEMSVLVHYMEQFPDMNISYTTVDCKQSIVFDVR